MDSNLTPSHNPPSKKSHNSSGSPWWLIGSGMFLVSGLWDIMEAGHNLLGQDPPDMSGMVAQTATKYLLGLLATLLFYLFPTLFHLSKSASKHQRTKLALILAALPFLLVIPLTCIGSTIGIWAILSKGGKMGELSIPGDDWLAEFIFASLQFFTAGLLCAMASPEPPTTVLRPLLRRQARSWVSGLYPP